MKVEVTDHSPVKKTMEVEVDADVVSKETKEVLRGYAKHARIPGFRQGKAPLAVIEKQFGQEVLDDVRDRVVARSYEEAAREKGLRPLGDPVLDEVSFEAGEPLRFKTTFEILPEIEVKEYKGIEVRRPSTAVTDVDIDEALESIRQQRVQLVPVGEDAGAETGHVVVADVEGTPEEGEPFRRERMMIELGVPDNLPAFNDALEGAKAGGRLEFSVDYPAEYPADGLAGKTVAYGLDVHEVKRKQLPDVDDEFAKDLGEFDDLEALKARIREDLENRKKNEAEHQVRNAILDKLLLEHPVVLPEVLVDQEVRHRLEDVVRRMYLQGMDPEKTEIDWVKLRDGQAEGARKSVHARLMLDAVAQAEGLEVTRQELDERIRDDAQRMGETPDTLRKRIKKGAGLQALENQLLREKSLDLLVAVANIQNEE